MVGPSRLQHGIRSVSARRFMSAGRLGVVVLLVGLVVTGVPGVDRAVAQQQQ